MGDLKEYGAMLVSCNQHCLLICELNGKIAHAAYLDSPLAS
jgi:hypothetical protein